MARCMLYLCLGPRCPIRPRLCMVPNWTAVAGITPPPGQTPVCWHLKNQIALSGETRGVKGSSLVSRVMERENMWSLKKEKKKFEGNTPHPCKMREMSFKAAPSLNPFLCMQVRAAENTFSWASAQIICQRKSVSNTSTSCKGRKRPSTQSTACEESLWVCCMLLSPSLLPAVPFHPKRWHDSVVKIDVKREGMFNGNGSVKDNNIWISYHVMMKK